MASEITYAEVKFKDASPAAQVKVPPKTKKCEHHPQKYPAWLPWLISLLLFLVCLALAIALLAASFCPSGDQPTALQQTFMEWRCMSALPQSKGLGWKCCPRDWKLFQESCYYLSSDKLSWAESEQNCTGMGAHLVVINSKAEQNFLSKELQKYRKGENYYIGLKAQELEGWHWVDQTPFNETAAFWRIGEPSHTYGEDCVVIHRLSEAPNNWNNVGCWNRHRICEAAAVTV
ncbi:C-type lectin domain family 4 member D [Dryobates pubescens]|uniref:C-type lectin domain family 4 member D n=1 Tax=Dryobates pubescens TaxID=118200 RepID=A0A093GCA8_DRYPU|nr:C-type lectin domain family 4 member D [Dryobates pubescens]